MKKLFINLPAICFLFASVATQGQNDMWLADDKTTLSYQNGPGPVLWEVNVGTEKEDVTKLEASYNKAEALLTITGTQSNGDVEVWDVQGNTVAEKRTAQNKTLLKKLLKSGTYYISYSNGDYAEGLKVVVKD